MTKWWNKTSVKISFGVVVIVAITLLWWKPWRTKNQVTYTEVLVGRGDVAITVLSTGTVQPKNRIEIKPPVPGRVEEVLILEGAQVKKGQILAWMSSSERAALLDAARAKGPAEVKIWEDLYRATPIMAPIDGTVILRNVEAGQTFASTDPVFVMSDRLTVKAQVDETDISAMKVGQEATIILDAYPKDLIKGKVEKIAHEAQTLNNVTTYIVDVLPDTVPDFMRSGMTANVNVLVTAVRDVLYIPSESIKVEEGQPVVLIKMEGKKRPRPHVIQTGLSDGRITEVISGLKEKESIFIPSLNLGQKDVSSNPFAPNFRRRGGR